MWSHSCPCEGNRLIWVGAGEPCNWCDTPPIMCEPIASEVKP